MAKQSGTYQNLWVGGNDLSGDVGSIDSADLTRTVMNSTAINVGANERLNLRRDGALTFTSFFNPAAAQSHPILSALPTTDVSVIWAATLGGSASFAIGDPAFALTAKQASYTANRAADGSLTFSTTAQAAQNGTEWGRLLTAGKASQSSSGALAALDHGEATAFGLQAYLQVFSLTGTSITVAIQESDDDAAADAYGNVTGGVFTAVASGSPPAAQFISTGRALAVEQYLRVNTTGTFTAAEFAVVLVRNTKTVAIP